jgi:dihydroxyacetone kinase-like predicted kinase
MAATQASEIYKDSTVIVVPTKNFGHAYSALSMLDYSSDDAETIKNNMLEAMLETETGMITESIRTAHIDGVDIVEGEYIGFSDKTMLVSNESKLEAFKGLLEKMNADEKSFVIAVYGEGVTLSERESVATFVKEKYPEIEFYEINGGQKVYEFIVILE